MSRLGSILNKLSTKAAIETGSSGGWTWTKYSDGTFEAIKYVTNYTTGAMTQVGSTGMYYSAVVNHTFPSGIGVQTITSCTCGITPTADYIMFLYAFNIDTTKVSTRCLRVGSAQTATVNYTIRITGTYS